MPLFMYNYSYEVKNHSPIHGTIRFTSTMQSATVKLLLLVSYIIYEATINSVLEIYIFMKYPLIIIVIHIVIDNN